MKESLKKHEEAKLAFNQSLSSSNSARGSLITADTIKQDIHTLYTLKNNGKKIKELMEKQKTARSKEYNFSYETVSMAPVTKKRQKKAVAQKKEESLLQTPIVKQKEIEKAEEQSVVVQDQSPAVQRTNTSFSNQCQHCHHNNPGPQFPSYWPPPPPYFNYFMPPPNFGSSQDMYRMYEAFARMSNGGTQPSIPNALQYPNFGMPQSNTALPVSIQSENGNVSLEYTAHSQPSVMQKPPELAQQNPGQAMTPSHPFYPFPYMPNPYGAFAQNYYRNSIPANVPAPVDEETGRPFVDSLDYLDPSGK